MRGGSKGFQGVVEVFSCFFILIAELIDCPLNIPAHPLSSLFSIRKNHGFLSLDVINYCFLGFIGLLPVLACLFIIVVSFSSSASSV